MLDARGHATAQASRPTARARRGLAAGPDRRLRPNRRRRPSPHPRGRRAQTSGATQALLAQSRAARAAGNYAQANATIERALRIAPSDASLWVELGEIELATGNAAQAATLARKALTLAAPDDSVAIADAQKLLRAAGGR